MWKKPVCLSCKKPIARPSEAIPNLTVFYPPYPYSHIACFTSMGQKYAKDVAGPAAIGPATAAAAATGGLISGMAVAGAMRGTSEFASASQAKAAKMAYTYIWQTWLVIAIAAALFDFGAIVLSLNLRLLGNDILIWLAYAGLLLLAAYFTALFIAVPYRMLELRKARKEAEGTK